MQRFRNSRLLRAGFSLIEVNMAIFVLAGGALALLGLFPLGLRESLAARNEMRVAAFCERFLGAARTSAEKPGVVDADTLLDAIEGDFGFTIGEAGDADDTFRVHEDPENSGVCYRAWWREPDPSNARSISSITFGSHKVEVVQLCVQATGDASAKKGNVYALNTAPIYAVDVVVSSANK